jgi:hypothetical protein
LAHSLLHVTFFLPYITLLSRTGDKMNAIIGSIFAVVALHNSEASASLLSWQCALWALLGSFPDT